MMHGLIRRFAMVAAAAALALGLAAGAAITTGTAAHAASAVTLPFTNQRAVDAVTVDRSGNVYVADNPGENGTVWELPFGSSSQVNAGFTGSVGRQPAGLAADAAGDVFVADPADLDVVELVHNRDGSVRQVTLPLPGFGLHNEPDAVAVDGAGDLFVVENPDPLITGGQPEVVEFKLTGARYSPVTLPFTGLSDPTGVAVDTFGDVFVTDFLSNLVLELPNGKKSQVTLLSGPFDALGLSGVAVDGSGDVILPRFNRGTFVYDVVELLRSTGYHSLVTLDTGLSTLNAVAVDTSYDVFVTDLLDDQVLELPGAALPPRIPGPPKITSTTVGDGTATVFFTASQSDLNSGNPITGYKVTVRQGAHVTSGPSVQTVPGTTSPITVTGLTNGTPYTVTVYASNAAGNGPESAPQVVLPATVPDAPTNVTATNSSNGTNTGTVELTFTPPASDGGLPIQNYTAVSSPGGIIGTSGNGTPSIQVTGLAYGTSYTFTVYATNAVGNGPASDPSNAVTPAPVPSPPQVPGAAAVDIAPPQPLLPPPTPDLGAAYVSCLPPANDGGSAIVSYTVTSSPGGITATGSSCPVLVTGLTAGTPYTFTVTATNAAGGTSQPSQSTAKVIPRTAPGGPEPANDNFASAQLISGASGSVSGTNVGATLETNEPTIQDTRGGASVWFKWVVPATGTYQFDTCTAFPDVEGLIGAFIGNSVGNLTEYPGAGPSLESCPAGEAGATQPISAIGGQTIYIKFDGINPQTNANPPYVGAFTVEWQQIS